MNNRRTDLGERGSTMVVVLAILVALLSAGAVALYLQVADTRTTSLVKKSRESLFCAEAGLGSGRAVFGENYAQWDTFLDGDPDNDPSTYPLVGDMDGDGEMDYEVTIRDNDDEFPTPDPTVDADLQVFIVSRCIKYPDIPREVMELVAFEGMGSVYRNQQGQGQGNTNNNN